MDAYDEYKENTADNIFRKIANLTRAKYGMRLILWDFRKRVRDLRRLKKEECENDTGLPL